MISTKLINRDAVIKNYNKQSFEIRIQHQNNKRKKSKKSKFTKEEDKKLCSLVKIYGENEWTLVAKNMENRNSRQVRDRWKNYLNPVLNCTDWSKNEDSLLISKFLEIGPSWKTISIYFPNRSVNSVRNRIVKMINNKKININLSQVFQIQNFANKNKRSLMNFTIPNQINKITVTNDVLKNNTQPVNMPEMKAEEKPKNEIKYDIDFFTLSSDSQSDEVPDFS